MHMLNQVEHHNLVTWMPYLISCARLLYSLSYLAKSQILMVFNHIVSHCVLL